MLPNCEGGGASIIFFSIVGRIMMANYDSFHLNATLSATYSVHPADVGGRLIHGWIHNADAQKKTLIKVKEFEFMGLQSSQIM